MSSNAMTGLPVYLAVAALETIAEHAQEGILIVDTETRYLAWNHVMVDIAGVAAPAVLGRRVLDAFPALAGSGVYEAILAALAGETVRLDNRPQPDVGPEKARWFNMVFAPLRNGDGTVAAAVGTLSEITHIRRTEWALAERENRLRAILHSEPECVKVVAEDGTLVDMNPAGIEMLEAASFDELRGMPIVEVIAPPYRAAYVELHRRVFTGRSGVMEMEIVGFKGTLRWVETHAAPLLNAEGAICAAVSVTRDISARKRDQHELQEARARTSRALAAAGLALWEIDLASRRVIWAENLEALFAGQPSTPAALSPSRTLAVGEGIERGLEWIHPDDRPLVSDAIERAAAAGTAMNLEYRVVWLDGTIRWVHSVAYVGTAADGEPPRLLGVTMDVTQRRGLEAQLRQSQKMEAVGRLAGGVAHDFNNLLTVIHGYSRLVAASSTPQQDADLKEVIRAAERAAALTRQLLAFSRRQVMQATILDWNAIVSDMTSMLQRLIGEQLALVVSLARDLRPVRGDRVQLEQVLMNLIVNARDAMPGGGRIEVTTSNSAIEEAVDVEGTTVPAGSYVTLRVRDDGNGMTDDVRSRIFEPFFTTKDRSESTGLGLATVYGIVAQSGGHVRVKTQVGRGTTIEVWLPSVEGVVTAIEPTGVDASGPLNTGTLILVVEDEPAVRRLARRILEGAGYRVVDAGDPVEAAVVFEEHREQIALVLTDVVMPGGTGPELYNTLRATKPGLRAVCMSAYAADRAFEDRAFDGEFVQKPFAAATLLQAIHRSLEGLS
jgi:two-component system, cell cycle sensor histidine kinase and response regulator CckA